MGMRSPDCDHQEIMAGLSHIPVIERPLKPLNTGGHQSILMQHHQMPRKRADSLAAHRVPLVRHSTAPNLICLEGLLNLLHAYKMTYPKVRDRRQVAAHMGEGRYRGAE